MAMALFNIQLADGSVMTTTCRRVRATVDGKAFWFAIHQFPGRVPKSISHIASGKRVCDLPTGVAFAMHRRPDEREMAMEALAAVAQRVGPARMRETLEAAEREPRSCAGTPHGSQPQG
ncbi:hypothetical protein GCM10007320_63420 [Pseudorhodoferax aquiterrae]|uniref:Uncharacterized protein n=1 Tax=Pseudorhodoferax aquiterrae TaxID=747304 RepID=A0ABQ3GEC6_9BURK|nr:hypothetical protein [Pseudorhodoferax aquiterrae]GHD03405.1 hypothetical protein GCM10007320_63420 [Pseudorhodoferax aquiterrae]